MASNDAVKAGFWYCKELLPDLSDNNFPKHFTHLIFAFADISDQFKVTIPNDCLDQFRHLADVSKVKTLLSIGGVDSYPSTVASMASNPANRAAFIQSSIEVARTNNFVGLDLFWPCWNFQPDAGPTPTDMKNLGSLFNEWHAEIQKDAQASGKTALLLSATVFYTPKIINGPHDQPSVSYPAEAMSNTLDWINVRAYDLYDPQSSQKSTKPHAALFNATTNELFKRVEKGISEWNQTEVPEKKIVLGLPYFGFEWLLENPDGHEIFAPAKGPATGNDGRITYREIMAKIGFTHEFSPPFVTNYCYSGYNWIGYDGPQSIKKKIQYAKQKTLRGYFAWHVCGDNADWTLSKTASEEWDKINKPGQ